MEKPQEFENYTYTLPPNRQLLAAKLMSRNWFKNSDLAIKKQVLSLPNDFDGFVFDLSDRPDSFGEMEVIKLTKLVLGNYLITPVFEVHSSETGKTFSYEYVSWKSGPHSGIKGTLFIEMNGQIKYFITIETDKFGPGKNYADSVGGLVQYAGNELINLPERVEKSIKAQLGIKTLKIKQFFDLGRLSPDNGLTNNHPNIFAAVIDGDYAKKLNELQRTPIKTTPQGFRLQIVPIEQLDQYIAKIDDAFFLATIARLLAKKVISL